MGTIEFNNKIKNIVNYIKIEYKNICNSIEQMGFNFYNKDNKLDTNKYNFLKTKLNILDNNVVDLLKKLNNSELTKLALHNLPAQININNIAQNINLINTLEFLKENCNKVRLSQKSNLKFRK